ncbi:hypothetical protein [Kurthia senegalensis]|nr:hypothetical protein [Kurthia senegalensis]
MTGNFIKGKLYRLQQLLGKQDRIGKGPFEEKLIETFHAMPQPKRPSHSS